jgi:hypothetical protein
VALVELNLNPDKRQLRTFGLIGLVVFGALAGWAWHAGTLLGFQLGQTQATATYALGALAGACGLFSAVFPQGNKPLFVTLSVVTMPIGFVLSHLIMLAMFFLVMTPIGLLLRLSGRDPLARSVDRSQSSYWSQRAPQPPVDRYFRQF